MDEVALYAALEVAQSRLKTAGGLLQCERPVQVALIVATAQGIIDNGGLQYFYESDFEDQLAYEEFVGAYRATGATAAADLLQRSIELIPFPSPHLHEKKRQLWLEQFRDDDTSEWGRLSLSLIGHPYV